ncbi:hypothetical protein ACFX14_015925 [Malus domestica]
MVGREAVLAANGEPCARLGAVAWGCSPELGAGDSSGGAKTRWSYSSCGRPSHHGCPTWQLSSSIHHSLSHSLLVNIGKSLFDGMKGLSL